MLATTEILSLDRTSRHIGIFAGTGSGKTLIAQLCCSLRGGFNVFIEPTIALQADQSLRQTGRPNTAVYDINHSCKSKEEGEKVLEELEEYLGIFMADPRKSRTICIYISPSKLNSEKIWQKFLVKLAKAGALKQVILDEIHLLVLDAVRYRSDFPPLKESLFERLSKYKKLRFVYMTATFGERVEKGLKKLYGVTLDKKFWAPAEAMYKESIRIQWEPRSRATFTRRLKECIPPVLSDDKNNRVIVYCETEKRTHRVKSVCLELYDTVYENIDHGHYIANVTGERPQSTKLVEIGLFSGQFAHPLSEKTNILVATAAAAGHGIDHPQIPLVLREGLPPCLSSFYQELGRVMRKHGAAGGAYHMVADLSSYYYLLTRAHGEKSRAKKLSLELLHEVMSLLFGNTCIHYALADRFGNPNNPNAAPRCCEDKCFVCDGSYQKSICDPIELNALSSFLTSVVNSKDLKLHPDLTQALWNDKKKLSAVFNGKSKKHINRFDVEMLMWHLAFFEVLKLEYVGGEMRVRVPLDRVERMSEEQEPWKAWKLFMEHRETVLTGSS